MLGERKIVAIDSDFFQKFTENNPDGALFVNIIDELEVFPVMHKYVYSYELAGNSTVKKLVKEGKIRVIDYDEYLPDNRSGYENSFKMAYQSFNFKTFDDIKYNVYEYQHAKENLGEIRTALMAFYMGVELMMSDDGEAKRYITQRVSSRRHPLVVYNIYDTLIKVGKLEKRQMKWGDVKGFAKRIFAYDIALYDKVNEAWHCN